MINKKLLFCLLLLSCLLFCQVGYGEMVELNRNGVTTISDTKHENVVVVTLETLKRKASPALKSIFRTQEIVMLEDLKITVNGHDVFVPYTVIGSIYDPRCATVKIANGSNILRIFGGDAAEGYNIYIYFNSCRVTRTKVFDPDFPNKPLQDCRFWIIKK